MLKIKTVKELFIPKLSFINNGKKNIKKNAIYFLDLSEFHVYEQLLIEESLFRLTPIFTEERNDIGFVIVNDTTNEKYNNKKDDTKKETSKKESNHKSIILGISGKINEFLKDKNYAKQNNVCIIKRYTGGGTVYINKNCLLVSLILPHQFAQTTMKINSWIDNNAVNNNNNNSRSNSENMKNDISFRLFPSSITNWSFHSFYGKFLNQQKNCLFTPNFGVLENDYISKIYDQHTKKNTFKKVGGNAQAFSKHYFVHHTSFLWSCNFKELDSILINPTKQPAYRNKRNHHDFIHSVQNCLNPHVNTPESFITNLIRHTKQILNEINSNVRKKQKELQIVEEWVFNKINFNKDNNLTNHFDNYYLLDKQLLKELYSLYNNNIHSKNLRTTRFLDLEGNPVCDDYYNISKYLIA